MRGAVGAVRMFFIYGYWNFINRIVFIKGRCMVGKSIRTRGRIRMINRGVIQIGDCVTINSSIISDPIGGAPCSIFVACSGAKIIVGDNTGLSNCAIFAREDIRIGKNVLIGAGVKIYDNDFHPVNYSARMENNEPVSRPVLIKDGAFIGGHTIILKGVTIGEKSVIGAGSVVTKTVPDGEIWAGNPARFVRKVKDHENLSN